MPKITDNLPDKNGYVLKFQWSNGYPFAVWGTVSASGQTVSSETFTDMNPVTTAIGGIQVGETFNNVPVTTMLRKLIYQYIGPTIQISLSNSILEIGDPINANFKVNYTITRTATQSINTLIFNPPITPNILPASITQGVTAGSSSLQDYPNAISSNSWKIITFTSSIADGVSSYTSSTSLLYTLPWYYGTATVSTTASDGINSILGTNSSTTGKLSPLLTYPATQSIVSNNKTLNVTTVGLPSSQGYVYFGYPSDFVDLVDIKDNNGYSVFTSFKKFTISPISSPQNLTRWGGRTYSFYILTGSTSSTIPQLTTINMSQSPFQFMFATQS
jgi:hypothetical protein